MRRAWLCVVALLALGVSWGGVESPRTGSVLLVSIDTLRGDRLNCYGYQRRRTSPNLDALARDSVLFERHIVASPWTTPSHMSLFTGLCPTAHGLTGSFGEINRSLTGKGQIPTLSHDVMTLPEILHGNGWTTAAFTGGVTLDPRMGFGRGFESYDTSMYKVSTSGLLQLMNWYSKNRDMRSFVFWHTFEVHAPYLDARFLAGVVPADRAGRIARALRQIEHPEDGPSVLKAIMALMEEDVYAADAASALYDGGIASMDEHLGRLLRHLRALGLYDQMLIVVTSDHGEQLGERDGRFYNVHGHSLYSEMIRVPLLIKLPGQEYAGRRVRVVTRAIDVMPTILDLVTVAHRSSDENGSLRPLWVGAEPRDTRLALSESTSTGFELKGIQSSRHKYILTVEPEDVKMHGRAFIPKTPQKLELFDLWEDPEENDNLLLHGLTEGAADTVVSLAAKLDQDLRARVARPRYDAQAIDVDEGVVDALRGLGYVD